MTKDEKIMLAVWRGDRKEDVTFRGALRRLGYSVAHYRMLKAEARKVTSGRNRREVRTPTGGLNRRY